jgi:hypothetical protein
MSGLQRKRPGSWPEELRARLSLVQFESKNCGIAAIPCDFQSNLDRSLCTSDCLVKRAEIELVFEVSELQEPARAQVALHYATTTYGLRIEGRPMDGRD